MRIKAVFNLVFTAVDTFISPSRQQQGEQDVVWVGTVILFAFGSASFSLRSTISSVVLLRMSSRLFSVLNSAKLLISS